MKWQKSFRAVFSCIWMKKDDGDAETENISLKSKKGVYREDTRLLACPNCLKYRKMDYWEVKTHPSNHLKNLFTYSASTGVPESTG